MASTQKKGNSRKKTPAPPPPPAYNAAARVAGGIVCALLALCVLVSYFNVDALLLVWIARVLKGTLGYGYYLTAPVLAAIAVIQLGHRGSGAGDGPSSCVPPAWRCCLCWWACCAT